MSVSNAGRINILFLGASPDDRARLRLDKEARELKKKIREGKDRDAFPP
ncbi:MAG: hypothetical protein MJE77_28995 [Proteobacteria bacterium]|nr:hypothetical protein [Pseudomonadota bacterium]